MGIIHLTMAYIFFFFALLFTNENRAQGSYDSKQIEVSLRMIGHQVLLNAGDSNSRVMPVSQHNNQYRIQFGSEFHFSPDELVSTVNRVMNDAGLKEGYIVEVVECKTDKVVYSYEMNNLKNMDIIPCKSRDMPRSCYELLLTISGTKATLNQLVPATTGNSNNKTSLALLFGFVAVSLLVVALYMYRKKRRKASSMDHDLISLGQYSFNKTSSELIIKKNRMELSGKEADLLLLLYKAANTTVEREYILNAVWGDDGDYVGRTLDVFISKLRKKLEADSNLKIVNIRGVGYKLVIAS